MAPEGTAPKDLDLEDATPSCGWAGVKDGVMGKWPDKFASEDAIFGMIQRGNRIFVHTGCGVPQYLIAAMMRYLENNPKAFFDAEVLHVWSMGIGPYSDKKFASNLRWNFFFIGNNARDSVNEGLADYTPLFLSEVPSLFDKGAVPIDVALIQTSPPDRHGFMSLGVSVDIVKAAVENAKLVIAQVNSNMPRVHGDGFINIEEVDRIIPHDEPLLEFQGEPSGSVAKRIGQYVSHFIVDGDTIQVGYGSLPNAIMANLGDKKHLGIHTELLSDGLVDLIRKGVVDNSHKSINKYKTIATFCMGGKDTYKYIHDNPSIEFRTIDYTNNPLIIAQHRNMVAINSALEIDLTGQVTAESLGTHFFSGIGGQADFMRGAKLAPGGRTIIAIPSTANRGAISRIVPTLQEGSAVSLVRGDIHYVITEYGIAYLHGKNVRERAMDLIAIAHPTYRPWLIQEAKKLNLIYKDQAFIPGKKGEYPEHLETFRTTRTGLTLFLRPVKLNDEPHLKEFFYSLSDQSLYRRFISARVDMPHERLQEFVVIDYTKELVILATVKGPDGEADEVLGVGEYAIVSNTHSAEVALVVRDDCQNKGVGTEILSYLTYLAKRAGLLGFTAEVLTDNRPMLNLFEKQGFDIDKTKDEGVYELRMAFKESVKASSGKG